MSCIFPVRLVMDIDVAGLSRPLSTDADASSGREGIYGDGYDTGDSAGEISSKSAADLGDVASKAPRSTVSISTSECTRLGDSSTDDRWDT